MIQALGRSANDTMNPYTNTGRFYNSARQAYITYKVLGSDTLWTTGQVGAFANTGAYFTSEWRTGYDNRTPTGAAGNIQLVTPVLTHWLSTTFDTHRAHIGMLTIQVPEPTAAVLLAVGAGALVLLRRVSRRE
jgi:hypothetical protein